MKPHGTLKCYNAGCRCIPCRAARARYRRDLRRARREGTWKAAVRADHIRHHIGMLGRHGLGTKILARRAGVSRRAILDIKHGKTRWVRATTAQKIQRIQIKDRYLIDARPTWILIQKLLDKGMTKTEIAARLRDKPRKGGKGPDLKIHPTHIKPKTAEKVEKLWKSVQRKTRQAVEEQCFFCGRPARRLKTRFMCSPCRGRIRLNYHDRRANRRQQPSSADGRAIIDAVVGAIPTTLPQALREELRQELALAILSGEVQLSQLAKQVPLFTKRLIRDYADRYGPVSIDYPLSGMEFPLKELL